MAADSSLTSAMVSLSIGTGVETFTQTARGYTTQVIVTHTGTPNIMINNGMIVTQYHKSWGPEDIVVAPTTQTFTVSSVFSSVIFSTILSTTSSILDFSLHSSPTIKETSSSFEKSTTTSFVTAISPITPSSQFQSTPAVPSSSSSNQHQSILAASVPSSTSTRPTTTEFAPSSTQRVTQTDSSPSGVILGSIFGGLAFVCLFTFTYHQLRVKLRQRRYCSSSGTTDNEAKFPELDDGRDPIGELIREGMVRNDRYEIDGDELAELAMKEEGGSGLGKIAELA